MYGDKWPCDIDIDEVVDHITDPDHNPDIIHTLVEVCKCNNEEVDMSNCTEAGSYAGSGRSSKCYVTSKRGVKYAKHHDGLNRILWRYYLLLAVRSYVADNDRSMKCCWALARALHYAQDGVLSRKVQLIGVAGMYVSGDVHDFIEESLDAYFYSYLKPNIIKGFIQEGVNAALSEGPMNFTHLNQIFKPETSVTAIAEGIIKGTAYTFVKFFEIINYIRRRRESINRTIRRLRLVSSIGAASFVLLAVLSVILHIPSLLDILGLLVSAMLAASWPLYRSYKVLELYALGIVNYPGGMLRLRVRRGVFVVTETYQPLLA